MEARGTALKGLERSPVGQGPPPGAAQEASVGDLLSDGFRSSHQGLKTKCRNICVGHRERGELRETPRPRQHPRRHNKEVRSEG